MTKNRPPSDLERKFSAYQPAPWPFCWLRPPPLPCRMYRAWRSCRLAPPHNQYNCSSRESQKRICLWWIKAHFFVEAFVNVWWNKCHGNSWFLTLSPATIQSYVWIRLDFKSKFYGFTLEAGNSKLDRPKTSDICKFSGKVYFLTNFILILIIMQCLEHTIFH